MRPSEDSAKIADIGEGRHITALLAATTLNASVEARDIHAPEVIASRKWSTESDIFAFGVAACKMLDERVRRCPEQAPARIMEAAGITGDTSPDSAAKSVVPAALAMILLSALAYDPSERWTAREYVDKLEELSMEFFTENEEPTQSKVVWSVFDWWTAFEAAHDRSQRKDGSTQSQAAKRDHSDEDGSLAFSWSESTQLS